MDTLIVIMLTYVWFFLSDIKKDLNNIERLLK